MAENVRRKFGTDFGVSITGIAGPDGGNKDKPVGTVWIGISGKESTSAYKNVISTDRAVNRERSVGAALSLLLRKLNRI
jgi:PncC family amidohydrolase